MSSRQNEAVEKLPPSAKLALTVLEHEGPLTQQQIADHTRLPQRTTREALTRLDNAALVEQEVYLPDARQSLYRLNETDPDPAPRPPEQV